MKLKRTICITCVMALMMTLLGFCVSASKLPPEPHEEPRLWEYYVAPGTTVMYVYSKYPGQAVEMNMPSHDNPGNDNFYNVWDNKKNIVTEIIVNDDIVILGRGAFQDFSHVTCVELPSTLMEIQDHAFARCSSLESILIGPKVTYIGGCAFKMCTSLETVTFASNSKLNKIDEDAFGDTKMTEINIPYSCKIIASGAFANNGPREDYDGLQKVTFENNKVGRPQYSLSIAPAAFKLNWEANTLVYDSADVVIWADAASPAYTFAVTYGFEFRQLPGVPDWRVEVPDPVPQK